MHATTGSHLARRGLSGAHRRRRVASGRGVAAVIPGGREGGWAGSGRVKEKRHTVSIRRPTAAAFLPSVESAGLLRCAVIRRARQAAAAAAGEHRNPGTAAMNTDGDFFFFSSHRHVNTERLIN